MKAVKLLSKLSVYSIGNISTALIGFILLPFYVRKLSVEEYGIYSLCEITGQFLIAIIAMGVPQAMLRWAMAEDSEHGRKNVVFNSLLLLVPSAALVSLIYFVVLNFGEGWIDEGMGNSSYFYIVLLYALLEALNLVVINIFRISHRALWYSSYIIVKLLVTFSASIFMLYTLHWGVKGVLYGMVFGSLSSLLIGSVVIFRSATPAQIDKELLRKMTVYGLPIFLGIMSAKLIFVIDRYIVAAYENVSNVAIYTLAIKLSSILSIAVVFPFQTGFLPIAYEQAKSEKAADFFGKVFKMYAGIILLIGFFIVLFSAEILDLVAGNNSQYAAGVTTVVCFTVMATMVDAIQYFFYIGLRIVRISKFDVVVGLVALVVNLSFNFLLIPKYGIVGAGTAKVISNLMAMFLLFYFSKKHYPVNYSMGRITVALLFIFSLSVFSISYANEFLLSPYVFKGALLVLASMVILLLLFRENLIKLISNDKTATNT